MNDLAVARAGAGRADERRDRARLVGAHLGDGGLERELVVGQPEVAAGDGRDHCHLVARAEDQRALGVGAVDGEEEAARLLPQLERAPDVADDRPVGEVDVDAPGADSLAERSEQPHARPAR